MRRKWAQGIIEKGIVERVACLKVTLGRTEDSAEFCCVTMRVRWLKGGEDMLSGGRQIRHGESRAERTAYLSSSLSCVHINIPWRDLKIWKSRLHLSTIEPGFLEVGSMHQCFFKVPHEMWFVAKVENL